MLSSLSGAALIGVSSTVTAALEDEKDISDEVINTSHVQSILTELNDPPIEELTHQVEEVGEVVITFVTIQTPIGKLTYAEAENEESTAHFSFEDSSTLRSPQIRRYVPEAYQRVPTGTHPSLYVDDDDKIVFRRSATEQEIQTLNDVVSISDDAEVIAGSDIDGVLIIESEEGYPQEWEVHIDEDFDALTDEIGNDIEIGKDNVTVEHQLQTLQSEDCGTWIYRCVSSGAACGACSGSCAGAPTGIGAVACAACIQGVCTGIAGTSCAFAVGICLG